VPQGGDIVVFGKMAGMYKIRTDFANSGVAVLQPSAAGGLLIAPLLIEAVVPPEEVAKSEPDDLPDVTDDAFTG
jgi:hypothetical protein